MTACRREHLVHALRRKLRRFCGVDLECKPHGLAVHYRRAEDKASVHLAVLAAVASLRGVRRIHGKDVIEVLPAGAPDKGEALALLRHRLKPRATLYVGDDVTDEDAFRSIGPGRLLTVRVAPAEATFARYRLDTQEEVEALLDELLRLAQPAKRSAIGLLPNRGDAAREWRLDECARRRRSAWLISKTHENPPRVRSGTRRLTGCLPSLFISDRSK